MFRLRSGVGRWLTWGGVAGWGLLAAWPLLTRADLPTNTDADLHIFRTAEILRAWAQGVVYVRWAPDLAFGYGYPVFNYYAPLAHYLAAAYAGWGGGAVAGVKFVLVASAVLGGVGMFALAREWWGDWGGLVSSLAFSFAPYVLYMNPMARGAVPETLAVGLAPGVWWSFVRLRQSPSGPALATAALAVMALSLAHNLLSLVFLALIGAWLVWESVGSRRSIPWGFILMALAIGLGASAGMWLPAWLERSAVQFQRALAVVQDPAAVLRFVGLAELLGPVRPAEVLAVPMESWSFHVGVPQWVLAGAGAWTLGRATPARRTTAYLVLASGGLLGLVLPQAGPLWRAVPLLLTLQLPWRLLGPLAVTVALLAGAGWFRLAPRLQMPAALAALGLIVASALPLLNPLPWAPYGPVTVERLWWFERQGNVGTTAQNEFLPVTVQTMPALAPSLAQSYTEGAIDKLDHATLPPGATSQSLFHSPVQDRYVINSPVAAQLTFLTFAFPGWQAYVDDRPVPIHPSPSTGWITIEFPAGDHQVRLQFEDTPPRRLGWIISGLALVAGAVLAAGARRPAAQPTREREPAGRLPVGYSAAVWGGLTLAVLAISVWGGLRPWQPAVAAGSEVVARFAQGLELVQADWAGDPVHPGDGLALTLQWRANGLAPRDLSVFVHLIGPDEQLWGQSDKIRPVAQWPTDRWPTHQVFVDVHQLAIRPDAPAGSYQLKAGLWDSASGERLAVVFPSAADSAQLGSVVIAP